MILGALHLRGGALERLLRLVTAVHTGALLDVQGLGRLVQEAAGDVSIGWRSLLTCHHRRIWQVIRLLGAAVVLHVVADLLDAATLADAFVLRGLVHVILQVRVAPGVLRRRQRSHLEGGVLSCLVVAGLELFWLDGGAGRPTSRPSSELHRVRHQLVVQPRLPFVLIVHRVPQVRDGASMMELVSRLHLELARGNTATREPVLAISFGAAARLIGHLAPRSSLACFLAIAQALEN